MFVEYVAPLMNKSEQLMLRQQESADDTDEQGALLADISECQVRRPVLSGGGQGWNGHRRACSSKVFGGPMGHSAANRVRPPVLGYGRVLSGWRGGKLQVDSHAHHMAAVKHPSLATLIALWRRPACLLHACAGSLAPTKIKQGPM